MATTTTPRTLQTLFFAIILLFFIQLQTAWIESIYRVSLMTLHPGKELLSMLLLLIPLALFLVDEDREKLVLWISLLVLLAARALIPIATTYQLVVICGLGVAAFIIFLCYALSNDYRYLQGSIGPATGIAVLLSVFFRSWGSSIDISMEGPTAILGWLLVAAALYLFWSITKSTPATRDAGEKVEIISTGPAFLLILSLFANFALIYLIFSSPAVVTGWSGADYLADTFFLVLAFALILLWLSLRPSPSIRIIITCNLLLVLCMVSGILLHRPILPMTPDSPPYDFLPPSWPMQIPFYFMFLLAPVIMLNVHHIARTAIFSRPREAILPVLLGMLFLNALPVILIFANAWHYVPPFSFWLRNKFYLPFLIAGIVMLLPYLVIRRNNVPPISSRVLAVMASILALLAVAGVLSRMPNLKPAAASNQTQLTIMSYNMQQGSSDIAGTRNFRKQLDLLRQVNADIIGLQESDTPRPSGGNVNCVQYFADELGYYAYYGPNTISGTFGTAILSRFPLKNPHTIFTYSWGDETATAVAEIVTADHAVAICNNHPAGARTSRIAHVNGLLAEVQKHERVISMGDYNMDEKDPWYKSVADVLTDSWLSIYPDAIGKFHPTICPPNAPSTLDMKDRIDHIFVSHNLHVLESYYLPAPQSQTDHPAHWAIIALTP